MLSAPCLCLFLSDVCMLCVLCFVFDSDSNKRSYCENVKNCENVLEFVFNRCERRISADSPLGNAADKETR